VIVNYDYPLNTASGLNMNMDEAYNDFAHPGEFNVDQGNAWARPAYHTRIRPGARTYMGYGGGGTDLGEYEPWDGDPNVNNGPEWWLPGFIAQPAEPNKPDPSWASSNTNLGNRSWLTYRYVIAPDRQEMWCDSNDDGIWDPNDLKGTQMLPQTSDTLPLYRYFDTLEGVRLFWRGGDPNAQAHVDWLTVDVVPEPITLSLLAGGIGLLLARRKSKNS